MALTAAEEAQVRLLLDQQASILSLANNEATITSKLGATKVTLTDLGAAAGLGGTDLFLVRQGTTDRSIAGALLKAQVTADSVLKTSATGSAVMPAGSTAQRDGAPAFGYLRANNETLLLEMWNGSAWTPIGSDVRPGTIIEFGGTSAPTGFLLCPISQTNISRATYAALFAAIGTTWGVGDGSTTFGMPWFAADYAALQANGNVGTASVGAVISHLHTVGLLGGSVTAASGANFSALQTSSGINSGSTGGSANLAAGTRVLRAVKI